MQTKTGRRIRNYQAMNDDKLKRVYREFIRYNSGAYVFPPDAVERCMTYGSGDIDRDMREIERVAEIRMIDLD